MREMKDTENRRALPDAEADGIIEGRNAVIEALRTETAIDKIYIAKGETDKTLGHIASKARAAGIVVVGHAAYYPRFGFTPASHFGLTCPFPAPDESFLALELDPGALAGKHGQVIYAPEFTT